MILSLGYFCKTLDQNNIANAYVSGMKEDLGMTGNQLNIIDIAWTTGYVIGQLPSQVIITKIRPSIWIPSCELVWTMLTFCLAGATTSTHVVIIRFFIGLMEGIFYPAAHFLIGSWYKQSELGKRACIFQSSSAVAAICSGYLQASVYKGLNGVGGKAGWQWLFVMDAVISFPICVAGFFIIPDLPENTRAFYLTSEDAELARKRMNDIGRAGTKRFGWSVMKRLFSRWHIYALSGLYLTFIISSPSISVNTFALWLKANNWPVTMIVSLPLHISDTTPLVLYLPKQNVIPTGQSAIQLVTTIFFAILSDYLRNRALVMSIGLFFGFTSSLLLGIWTIPISLKWFAYFTNRISVAVGPLSMTWANEICSAEAEERAIVIGMMNSLSYAFNAWLPLLTYPASEAPRFKTGFIFSTCTFGMMFGITGLIAWLRRREIRKKEKSELSEVGQGEPYQVVET